MGKKCDVKKQIRPGRQTRSGCKRAGKTSAMFSPRSADMASKCPVVYMKTFGCQMNVRDSEALAGLLKDAGYKIAESEENADIILFNTCSVRQHAEDKVWSEIGRLNKIRNPKSEIRSKSQFPNPKSQNKLQTTNNQLPIIGVIGCMAQNYKEEIFKRSPNVDLVVGPNDLFNIPALIKKIIEEKTKALSVSSKARENEFYLSNFHQEENHAYVVISEGCDNFCSYCLVPFVRGRLHHRNYRDILEEIKKNVASGIKSITLLGQNVNSYQSSAISHQPSAISFVKLLEMVNDIDGLEEFDFVTSHPKNTNEDLFLAMRDLEKCKKSLHLPIQSGSDRILNLMNRGYTSRHYRKLVDKYRKLAAGKISTDIIVGFPSESEKDFKDTLALLKEIEFNSAYIFKYSPRPRTQAEKLEDNVPKEEKERRHKILLDLQEEISRRKR